MYFLKLIRKFYFWWVNEVCVLDVLCDNFKDDYDENKIKRNFELYCVKDKYWLLRLYNFCVGYRIGINLEYFI